ncbi:hypothetical protein PoB_006576500 [Plakobranchus ocellatus]|uniref:Uncharacterized protein n=1 Tax=Plakobranchus ocellatus TaxID=259542 RepID=A0AAV4D593_9GAST|nr:hypothetical protein PoB_006576500 [Plakobranchus ocellatus]
MFDAASLSAERTPACDERERAGRIALSHLRFIAALELRKESNVNSLSRFKQKGANTSPNRELSLYAIKTQQDPFQQALAIVRLL